MIKYATLQAAQEGKVAPWDLKVDELSDFHVTVFRDRFPVTEGHLLFVPNYNTTEVINEAFYSAQLVGEDMIKLGECEAYNIGINQGAAAGSYGAGASGNITGAGAATAAGQVGSTNALTNALSSYLNYSSGQNLADAIRKSTYGPA